MNDYSIKSLKTLGVFIALALLILSFVIFCYDMAHGGFHFVTIILPIATMIYGAVMFIKKFMPLK